MSTRAAGPRRRLVRTAALLVLCLSGAWPVAGDGTGGGCGKSPPYSQPSDGCHFLLRGMPFHVYGRVAAKTSSTPVRIRVWVELSTGREMVACEASGKGSATCEEVDPDMPRVDIPGDVGVDDSRCYVEATVAAFFYCRAGTGA